MSVYKLFQQDINAKVVKENMVTVEEVVINPGLNISDKFLMEINKFINRNSLKVGNGQEVICMRCVKAFAYSLVKKDKFPPWMPGFLFANVSCELGHEGNYYLDQDELKKF